MDISTLPVRVTAEELSAILNIAEKTVKALVKTNQIPFRKEKRTLYFDFAEVMAHFKSLEGGAA